VALAKLSTGKRNPLESQLARVRKMIEEMVN